MTPPKPKQTKAGKAEAAASAPALPSRARAHAREGADSSPPPVIEARFDPAGVAARFVPVEQLVPYARNSRTHSDAQVAQIAASIIEFGFTNPVLADEKGIVAGHGRVLAARKLFAAGKSIRLPNGLELPAGAVPVIDVTGWSDEKRRAYVIADNQLALNAGWDNELLKLELQELKALDFDLDLLGFDAKVLDGLLAEPGSEGLTDPDEIPEAPSEPVTRPGEVWLLGRHRITCGDSTVATDVERVLAGVKPHLMVTDPPYGVEYDAGWRNEAMPAKNDPTRWKDGAGRATGAVLNDDKADWREAWALFPGDVAYIWHAGNMAHVVAESLIAGGFGIRAQIIWAKSQFVIGRGHYHPHHEPCWYAVRDKQGATGHWNGDRKQSTLWQIDKPQKSETGHSTQKPVECMKRPIENNSSPGQAVYEPFSGSGTTIIAGEMTGRQVFAIELNPVYVDVAVTRWEAFTGQAAVLEGDGRTFAELMAERLPPGSVKAKALEPKKKPKAA
jgi:DNA modification methylase